MARRTVVALGIAGVAALVAGVVVSMRGGGDEVDRAPIGGETVVMLGDSITEQGDWSNLLPGVPLSNAGYAGFTTEQLVPVAAEVAARQPHTVVVLTGTNDIRDDLGADVTGRHLGAVIDAIRDGSPTTRVVVHTLLPRADAVGAVLTANEVISSVAAARGVEVVDLYAPFDDGAGGLRPGDTTDGIHLSPDGYERWAAILRDSVVEASPTPSAG